MILWGILQSRESLCLAQVANSGQFSTTCRMLHLQPQSTFVRVHAPASPLRQLNFWNWVIFTLQGRFRKELPQYGWEKNRRWRHGLIHVLTKSTVQGEATSLRLAPIYFPGCPAVSKRRVIGMDVSHTSFPYWP
jgi:hypothetical protein